jgi:hypothetical protein
MSVVIFWRYVAVDISLLKLFFNKDDNLLTYPMIPILRTSELLS